MKRIITIITICLLSLFLLKESISSLEKNGKMREDYHRIFFDNLNTKNINELFEDLNGMVIEVEIKTRVFTKAYRLNTAMINNVEEKLSKMILEDLELVADRELVSIYKTSGFIVTRMDLICSDEIAKKIKDRSS